MHLITIPRVLVGLIFLAGCSGVEAPFRSNPRQRARPMTDNKAEGPAATPAQSLVAPLRTTVFNPGKEAIFPVSSTIVYGPREAMLVDAQFQRKYAAKLVAMVKATGRTLKYIYISHSDPDYYFGLAEVRKAFPEALVLSTAQTAYLISATKDAKLKVWKDKLDADAPTELTVPEAVSSNELTLDGEKMLIKTNLNDPAHGYLWIPSTRTILGGISVLTGAHLWMADTPSLAAIDAWLQVVEDMKGLAPARVIAGHFETADESPGQLDFVHDYLAAYRQAASANKDSAGIVTAMKARFPKLPGLETLEFGAKAFTGEVDWHVAGAYPPVGRVATVDFGGAAFRLNFVDNRTMSFEDTSGAFQGVKDTVNYTPVEVSRNVFMVYWHEPSTGSNVVHLQNWNTGTVWTNIAAKDGSFTNLKGTIRLR